MNLLKNKKSLIATMLAVVLTVSMFALLSVNSVLAYPSGSDSTGTWNDGTGNATYAVNDYGTSLQVSSYSTNATGWTKAWRVSEARVNFGYGYFIEFSFHEESNGQLAWFYANGDASTTVEPGGFYLVLFLSEYDNLASWKACDGTTITPIWNDTTSARYHGTHPNYLDGTWFFWYDSGALTKKVSLWYMPTGSSSVTEVSTWDAESSSAAANWCSILENSYSAGLYVYAGESNFGNSTMNKIRYFGSFGNDYREPTEGTNNWYKSSGTWALDGYNVDGASGILYTLTTYNEDTASRVEADMQTITAGGNTWDTAVMMIRWQNINNQITTRLFTDGTLELIQWVNGQNAYQYQKSTQYSCYSWHKFTAVIYGSYIEIYVDDNLEFTAFSYSFYGFDGKVGFQSGTSSVVGKIELNYDALPWT